MHCYIFCLYALLFYCARDHHITKGSKLLPFNDLSTIYCFISSDTYLIKLTSNEMDFGYPPALAVGICKYRVGNDRKKFLLFYLANKEIQQKKEQENSKY